MFMRSLRAVSLVLVAAWSMPAISQSNQSLPEWMATLRQGGHVIVVRHGATHADQADTDPLNPKNVSQQRHLNEDGRALAASMGDALHKLGIPVSRVYTSLFQRAVDTGSLLGFGEVTPISDVTEGGLVVTPTENNRRAQALRALMAAIPPTGSNVVIVTHKPNIMDAFGKDWIDVREGEASVFRPDGRSYTLIARVRADEWPKFTKASSN